MICLGPLTHFLVSLKLELAEILGCINRSPRLGGLHVGFLDNGRASS